MSAIFGIFHLNGDMTEVKDLQKMQDKIGHYGLDSQNIVTDQNIGIGGCLNKVGIYTQTDVPVYDDKHHQILLAGDAIIFNKEELMTKYRLMDDIKIATQDLLSRAYLKWDMDCPKYLNGDFVFAVWDKRKQLLLLFRDHLGVRPLYYFFQQSIYAFASDYRALLALPFVGKQLDEIMLYSKLSDTYHIDTESTYFAGIKRLPQAHVMRIDKHGISKIKYWIPKDGRIDIGKTEEEYAMELSEIVQDAIKLRLGASAHKIASEFSGGIDSSLITVLAHRELKKNNRILEAYSWSPAYELFNLQEGDERKLIQTLCEQEGLECRYRSSYFSIEQEIASPVVLTDGQRNEGVRQVLQEISSRGNRLVLSGWGGDEGISHRADLPELLINGDISHFIKEALFRTNKSPIRFLKLLLTVPVFIMFRPYSYFGTQNKGIPPIIRKEFTKKIKKQCKKDILYFKVNPMKHIESGVIVSRTEMMAWLGADYQIQYLFPFLDHRVMEYAMSLPRHLYYKNGLSRYIYRKAFENDIPHQLCYLINKDDIAKQEYRKRTENVQKKAERLMQLLQKDRFAYYIDWEIVNSLVNSRNFQMEKRNGNILSKLQVCYDIQRILDDI